MSEEIPIEIQNTLERIAIGSLLPWNRVSGPFETIQSSEQTKIHFAIARTNEYYQTTQKQSSSIHFTDESFWVF